ncbi:hypothetical protein [Fimbriiglobus ruber]|uniref:Uncharacterized protein n=1 Tax=Fimbriiglobus ruber TaxID=1908690 RepID=A0A225D9A9_9BACT|nr:hypothetical protein [Fimbriiglobus ruber]OWK36244.1 hypothetical protein FRUB_08807 [Fimbriiglobus ruber]
MTTFHPTRFRWPVPWQPLTDETAALGELRRETCDHHPLACVECHPIVSDPRAEQEK